MSRWVAFNPNPQKKGIGDCAVRAVAKALGVTWDAAYSMLAAKGYAMKDLPNANHVWGAVLRENGFDRRAVPNSCPDCYTAEDFATDHQEGIYVLGFGDHTAAVIDGQIFDSWDSSGEVPQYYWTNGEE